MLLFAKGRPRAPLALQAAIAFALPALAQPTRGFVEYQSTFKVQKPYDIPVEQRFSDTGGMYTTKVYPNDNPFEKGNTTEPRTEMRWETWTDQTIDHMYEADVMYESKCNRTCIMQVKSNTAGEAVYLRVLDGGDLIWLGAGATILKGYYGKWFNLKASFNPASRVAKVWIDDQLKYQHSYSSSKDWYFKNGTYTVEGSGPAVAHFKNIKHRYYDPSHAETGIRIAPKREAAPAFAGPPVVTVRDLLGRSAGVRGLARGVYLIPGR